MIEAIIAHIQGKGYRVQALPEILSITKPGYDKACGAFLDMDPDELAKHPDLEYWTHKADSYMAFIDRTLQAYPAYEGMFYV